MRFAVIFDDRPGQGALREQHLQAHLLWLDENRDWVLVGGSLRETPEQTPLGGLWIVEAESRQAVQERIKSDPFLACGLRAGVQILHWNKAFPSRQVAV
jgi:uncharacterized protein YciI